MNDGMAIMCHYQESIGYVGSNGLNGNVGSNGLNGLNESTGILMDPIGYVGSNM